MKQSTRDLIAYLEQKDLKYAQRSDDEDLVMLGITTQRASFALLFICEAHLVQLQCRLPFRAQPEQLDAVKDYFTRINYFLKSGCFELDVRDGEMNMRGAAFLTQESLSADQAERLLSSVTHSADDHLAGLRDVLYRQVKPAEAAASVLELLQAGVPPGVMVC